MKSKNELRNKIIKLVDEYYNSFHQTKEYIDGDRISYAGRCYGKEEMENLIDASLEFWLTTGYWTNQFEKKFGDMFGVKFVSFVNSGSSANLLAFMALTSPLLKERRIKRGDEVITVSCGFPTTIAPIIQYGAVPVFVDVTIPQYNIDVSQLDKALSSKTKAIMIAHSLGNPFNLKAIKDFCVKHNLWLIEDNCDALGSKYLIDGELKYTGTIGDIGTSSFYPPHHLTTGEGGAVYTNNPLLHKIIKSLRDWGRDCVCPSGCDNFCEHRFDGQYGQLPKGYDHKYVYSHFGYNLKATDLQASIGVAQLDRLKEFIEKRKYNFNYLKKGLSDLKNYIILPEPAPLSDPSWFGFLITVKDGISRNTIVNHLEKCNIQTRNLFAGNIIKHPCFDYLRENKELYRVIGDLNVTNKIMKDTFWIGVSPIMNEKKLNKIIQEIHNALLTQAK